MFWKEILEKLTYFVKSRNEQTLKQVLKKRLYKQKSSNIYTK